MNFFYRSSCYGAYFYRKRFVHWFKNEWIKQVWLLNEGPSQLSGVYVLNEFSSAEINHFELSTAHWWAHIYSYCIYLNRWRLTFLWLTLFNHFKWMLMSTSNTSPNFWKYFIKHVFKMGIITTLFLWLKIKILSVSIAGQCLVNYILKCETNLPRIFLSFMISCNYPKNYLQMTSNIHDDFQKFVQW